MYIYKCNIKLIWNIYNHNLYTLRKTQNYTNDVRFPFIIIFFSNTSISSLNRSEERATAMLPSRYLIEGTADLERKKNHLSS